MSLVAWYRPYEGDTSILDYGKDENPSDLREKKTSDDKTYYSVQNDFDTAFKTIGSLTLSVWVNTESTLPETAFGQPGFVGIISIASGRNLGLRMTDSGLVPSYAYYDSTSTLKYLDSSVVINDGEDHWIAVTQDQEKISLWVDGEKDVEVVTHINGGFPIGTYIGNSVISLSDDAFENLSDGEWGDLRVYDEALSEDILRGIFEADSFHSDNSSSFYKAATVTIGGNTVADVTTHSFIMMDSEGLWRSIDTTHEFSITSPIYFYRGPDKSDATNPPTCIRDGYLMDKGPVDARKALLGSYASYFEFIGPVYFNTTSNAGNTLKFRSPLCIYSPTATSIPIGEVLNRDELVFVNIQLGQEEANGRKAFGEYFKGVISGVDNFPKKPWKVGDYLVVSESFSYVGTNFVKGNAYTYNGTGWTIIEANGDNSAKLQELLGILLEAGVDLEDISNANTVSWFNTIVANAIVVGHMTLVITQYGFSTSNTVEPTVWSPILDLSEDGQYMEATWGDSYITWEDQVIRFVLAEGDFLWTRTSSDNGKTWQVHCVTGESGASVESITPLYYYTAGSIPSRPTQPVTSTSKAANQWTRVLPNAIDSTYKYYTCSEIEFDSANAGSSGFTWSEVIEDIIASQAGYSYYQFTAADGLFQSIQGQVDSISGSYVQSSINQTTNEISLLVSKSSGATTKTTIGGIKISLDSNGNPYIVLDGNADITGALTAVDVYSKSLRDYATDKGQSISTYVGKKFLPADLDHGYALSDNEGSLQANEAYLNRMVAKNASLTGTFATTNFMAGVEGITLNITPTTSGSYKCIKTSDLAGIGPNCVVAFTSGSITFTSGAGPYGISSVSASTSLPIYVEYRDLEAFTSLQIKAYLTTFNSYLSVWGGTLDAESGMFLGDSSAYNALTKINLTNALSAVGVSSLIPRDPPSKNYQLNWGYFNNTKSRYTESTIGTDNNRYKNIYSYCSDNAYAYNFMTTGELAAVDYLVLGSRIKFNPDTLTSSYENTYGGTIRLHPSAYGLFCEFNEGSMGETDNIKRAFNVVQTTLDHDGGDAITNPSSDLSIEANINLPRFNHNTTNCRVYGAVFN